MKANNTDRNESGTARCRLVETSARNIEEANLFVEEIKEDEEITIRIERIEDVIAPAPSASHHRARGSDSK